MLKTLKEEQFMVLRGPLESGRQSQKKLALALFGSVIMQALLFTLIYFLLADYSFYPNKDFIMLIHLLITSIITVGSILFSIPYMYKRFQKAQYLFSILASQNAFGITLYIGSLFLLSSDVFPINITANAIVVYSIVILILGLLVLVLTSIRFYRLLRAGEYVKGTKKDELRSKFEAKSIMPLVIPAALGVSYITQFIVRNSYSSSFNEIIIIVFGPLLFMVMLFVLPEQLVILYCKYRFKSFNFDEKGRLYPLQSEEKVS